MGTRGIWGFKYKDEYKTTYNHFDSYLEGLGSSLKDQLKNYTLEQMRDRFPKIMLVNDTDKAMPVQIQELYSKGYIPSKGLNGEDITGTDEIEWYSVLREWQGRVLPYMEYDLPYMTDGEAYAEDWIEYSYLIDLDDGTFKSYKDHFMNGGHLISSIPFDQLHKMSEKEYCKYRN